MKKIFLIPLEISGILIAVLVVGLAGAAFGIYQFNKKPPGVDKMKTDYSFSADKLFDEFDTNESDASEKYVDKVIEVDGKISDLIKDEGSLAVILEAENAMIGGINAAFEDRVEISAEKGQSIRLKCICVGYNMEVILNKCIEVK